MAAGSRREFVVHETPDFVLVPASVWEYRTNHHQDSYGRGTRRSPIGTR